MALEQAQQQFSAAARIGYESRPLNLFYGLSQAGRAIAAASQRLKENSKTWQASGHGLKFDPSSAQEIFAASVAQDGGAQDLFSRVSIALDSARDFGDVKLGDVVNQLLDYTMAFPQQDEYLRPLPGTVTHGSFGVPTTYPIEHQIFVPDLATEEPPTLQHVKEMLARYPALRGLEIARNGDGSPKWGNQPGQCIVKIERADQLLNRPSELEVHLVGADEYRGQSVLLPAAGSSAQAFKPLMSWWVVLFALSMLARYSPSVWTQTLSLAGNPMSSRVEFLLDTALDAVPELIVDSLTQISLAQNLG
jgi:hypothetical protein